MADLAVEGATAEVAWQPARRRWSFSLRAGWQTIASDVDAEQPDIAIATREVEDLVDRLGRRRGRVMKVEWKADGGPTGRTGRLRLG
jgi:hypothetical protein